MRIIQQLIDKKIDNYAILKKSNQELPAIQEHISAYMLSLSYLGETDLKIKKKTFLFYEYARTGNKKHLIKLSKFRNQEDAIIIKAIRDMNKIKSEVNQRWSSLFDTYCWAILSYEHGMEE